MTSTELAPRHGLIIWDWKSFLFYRVDVVLLLGTKPLITGACTATELAVSRTRPSFTRLTILGFPICKMAQVSSSQNGEPLFSFCRPFKATEKGANSTKRLKWARAPCLIPECGNPPNHCSTSLFRKLEPVDLSQCGSFHFHLKTDPGHGGWGGVGAASPPLRPLATAPWRARSCAAARSSAWREAPQNMSTVNGARGT